MLKALFPLARVVCSREGVLAVLLATGVCGASAQDVRSVTRDGVVHSLRVLSYPEQARSWSVAADRSRLVLFRPAGSSVAGAGSVFIEGMYHSSLVAGAYTSTCMRPGNIRLSMRKIEFARGERDGTDLVTTVEMKPGQTTYVLIRDAGNDRMELQAVQEMEAVRALTGARLQSHSISRVVSASPC